MKKHLLTLLIILVMATSCGNNSSEDVTVATEEATQPIATETDSTLEPTESTESTEATEVTETQSTNIEEQKAVSTTTEQKEQKAPNVEKVENIEKVETTEKSQNVATPVPSPTPIPIENSVTIQVLSPEGVLVQTTTVNIVENESVYSVTEKVLKQNGIALHTRGTKDNKYVEGIGDYYEFDYGPNSGYVYAVNNDYPNISSSKYLLNDGDTILWSYKK